LSYECIFINQIYGGSDFDFKKNFVELFFKEFLMALIIFSKSTFETEWTRREDGVTNFSLPAVINLVMKKF